MTPWRRGKNSSDTFEDDDGTEWDDPDPGRRWRVAALWWLGLCFAVLCVGVVTLPITCRLQPNDSQLVAHFRAHRVELEILVEKAQEDRGRFRRITDSNSFYFDGKETYEPRARLSEERLQEYRRLIRNAGVTSVAVTEKGIKFDYHTGGIALAVTESKGFLYTRKNSKENRESLGGFTRNHVGTRKIDGNWYIYFDRYDQ